MSLLFIDGCGEIYDTASAAQFWTAKDAGVDVVAAGGRRGGAAIRLDGINDDIRIGVPGAATVVCGFAFKRVTFSAGNDTILTLLGHGVIHGTLETTDAGAMRVTRSGSVELGISSGGLVSTDTWHYCEIKYFVNNGAGTVEVRLDGDIIINETALNTLGSGVAEVQGFIFLGNGISNATLIDDVYILDTNGVSPYNDFLGDSRIDGLLPDGDGFSSAFGTTFPASPTTHFTKVDEAAPNGDTDYNESNVANEIDLFDFAALPTVSGGATVWAVQASAFLNKQDAGPAPCRLLTRPTSATFNGAQQEPSTDYLYKHEIWELNPQTSLEWTESEVDAAEFGVEAL